MTNNTALHGAQRRREFAELTQRPWRWERQLLMRTEVDEAFGSDVADMRESLFAYRVPGRRSAHD